MNKHWWESVGRNGLPRFYIFLTPSNLSNHNYKHINVVELEPTATVLPRTYRSRCIKRTLLRTVPLYMGDEYSSGYGVFSKAERVVELMNSMTLSVMAVEQEKHGLQRLFEKLWDEDDGSSLTAIRNVT